MAISLPNADWAKGFFRQACFDWLHGKELFARPTSSEAIALAQFQQAVEKALKAAVLWETKKRLGRDESIVMSHTIWKDSLEREGHLRNLKLAVLKAIDPCVGSDISALEDLAPHGTIDVANTEYPWETSGDVNIPADYFAEEDGRNTADKLMGVADAIMYFAKGYHPEFRAIFQKVKDEFERGESLTDGDANHDRT